MSVDSVYFSPKGVTKEDVFNYFKNRYGEIEVVDRGTIAHSISHYYEIVVHDPEYEEEHDVGINGFWLTVYNEPDEQVNSDLESYNYPAPILAGSLTCSCEADEYTIEIIRDLAQTLGSYMQEYGSNGEWIEYTK